MHTTSLESRASPPNSFNLALLHKLTRPTCAYNIRGCILLLLWPCSKCNTICRTNYQSKRKELEDTIMCDGFRNVPWKESPNYLVHYLSPIFEQANFRGFPPAWDWPETWVTLPSPGFLHSFSPDLPLFPVSASRIAAKDQFAETKSLGGRKKKKIWSWKKILHPYTTYYVGIYTVKWSLSLSRGLVTTSWRRRKEEGWRNRDSLHLCVCPLLPVLLLLPLALSKSLPWGPRLNSETLFAEMSDPIYPSNFRFFLFVCEGAIWTRWDGNSMGYWSPVLRGPSAKVSWELISPELQLSFILTKLLQRIIKVIYKMAGVWIKWRGGIFFKLFFTSRATYLRRLSLNC